MLFPLSCTAGSLADMDEVFQPDKGMGMLLDNLVGNEMVRLQFQPSLSLADALDAPFRATSAFLLQAFAQSCVMVRLVPGLSVE
jgi:hypothetical protein